jgi:oligopeptide transport system ATP-binding protein
MSLLLVDSLRLQFAGSAAPAVDGVTFALDGGEALGVVGESGSGKSQTAYAILGLSPPGARLDGSIRFDGRELLGLDAAAYRRLRGDRIAMVPQDPMGSLNPHLTLGLQMAEVLEVHRGVDRRSALAESRRLLEAVRMPEAVRRLAQHPHELSGGQRQRVVIAMALLCRPQLLIADEPTTALDMTVQAQIVTLLAELRRELGLALLLISHDLALVGALCERALVLRRGQVVEAGASETLLRAPAHPYTRALLAARPQLDRARGTRLSPPP